MKLADWQFWICTDRYRIREDAAFVDLQVIGELLERIASAQYDADGIMVDADGIPIDDISNDDLPLLNQGFYYRRTLTVAPQKTGKGPMSASFVAFEAALLGPQRTSQGHVHLMGMSVTPFAAPPDSV